MKKYLLVILSMLLLCVGASGAIAADQWHQLSVTDALTSQLGKDKISPSIQLFMQGQKHGKVQKTIGEYKANKRGNAFGKSAQAACERVFISALMALQDRAVREGANAVIDIYTITKDKKFVSATEYSCIKGGFITNVALSGTVVNLTK